MKAVYHSHVISGPYFVYKCKFCGTLNLVQKEYAPYVWEHCELCDCINCVCPTLQDEETQDRVNPVT